MDLADKYSSPSQERREPEQPHRASVMATFRRAWREGTTLLSLIAGASIAGGFYSLAIIIEQSTGLQPSPPRVEVAFVLAVLGLTFGYLLGQAFLRKNWMLYFATSFLAVFFGLSLWREQLFVFPSLGSVVLLFAVGMFALVPAISKVPRILRAFNSFFAVFAWYILWLHVTYVYEVPLLQAFAREMAAGSPSAPLAISFAVLSLFLAVFAVGFAYILHRKMIFQF